MSPTALLTGLAGGLAAAVIGAIVWGLLVKMLEYEVGFVAWGIGFLAGMAVFMVSGSRRGVALQFIAVASAALGIMLGKFLGFMFILADYAAAESGESVSLMGVDWLGALTLYIGGLSELLGAYDVLWIGLAVVTAWKIPAPVELPAPTPAQA